MRNHLCIQQATNHTSLVYCIFTKYLRKFPFPLNAFEEEGSPTPFSEMYLTMDDFKTCKTKGCKCETGLPKCIYCMSVAERKGNMDVTNYLVRRNHLPFNNSLYELMKRTQYGRGVPFTKDYTPKILANDHGNCKVVPDPPPKLTPHPVRRYMPTPSADRANTSVIIPAQFVNSWNNMEFMKINPKRVIYSSNDLCLMSVDLVTYEQRNPFVPPQSSGLRQTSCRPSTK